MFTGIIEEVGKLKALKRGSKNVQLTIQASKVLQDTKLGDSIATNGVCLTVTNLTKDSFDVDVMIETLNRTTMQTLQVGSKLNLERALTLSTRLGGHLVSGHIDGVGTITAKHDEDIATVYTIKTSPSILKYIIEKGSIAIDGISLTVVRVDHQGFDVSIIPHTKSETTLQGKTVGSVVNLECDLIGKYVEKLMKGEGKKTLTEEVLDNYGY